MTNLDGFLAAPVPTLQDFLETAQRAYERHRRDCQTCYFVGFMVKGEDGVFRMKTDRCLDGERRWRDVNGHAAICSVRARRG